MPVDRPWRLPLGGAVTSLSLVACSPTPMPGVGGGTLVFEAVAMPAAQGGPAGVAPAPGEGPAAGGPSPGAALTPAAPGGEALIGGGAPPPIVTLTGTVTALDDAAPVAGARVTALGADGLVEVATDEAGRFSLTGRGLPQEVAVAAGGFVPRVTAGWAGPGADVRLRRVASPAAFAVDASALPLSGTVLSPGGQPVKGARVVGADGEGGRFGPVETDESGRFSGFASVPLAFAPAGMTLLAYHEGEAGLAIARRVPASTGAVGELVLTPAVGSLALTPGWAAGETRAVVTAHATDGPALPLASWRFGQPGGIEAPFFALPGVTLVAEAHAATDEGDSGWTAVAAGPGTLAPTLLPQLEAPMTPPRRDRPLAWPAVAGAEGYRLTLRQPGAATPAWEAVCAGPGVTLLATPDGATQLDIVAFQGDTHRAGRRLHLP